MEADRNAINSEPNFPETVELGDDQLQVERLAAVKAALDPDRRATRNDILITAVVETLARRGPMTGLGLTRALKDAWRTNVLTELLVVAALEAAFEANLVRREHDLSGGERWTVTDAAAIESSEDRHWAEAVVASFEAEVAQRLDDLPDADSRATKPGRAATFVYSALAAGADGMYALKPTLDPEEVRPLEFDGDAARRWIEEHVEPRSARSAVLELTLSAMDPDDDFGKELVKLLTVGNLLHAFLVGRDLARPPDLNGHRILLDTPLLIDLADTRQAGFIQQVVSLTRDLGVEVIVADHTLEEWDRVWEAAEVEVGAATVPTSLRSNSHRLAGNPFVRFYLERLEEQPGLTWARFEADERDIRPRLVAMGVHVRGHGNVLPEDRTLADAVKAELKSLSKRAEVPGHRTEGAAAADGESCAMVCRWRRDRPSGPEGAYFVSRERLTDLAHRNVSGDASALPITISPTAWVTYVTSLVTDDPTEVSRVAEVLADATVRNSFFGMATGFTLDEALRLSDQLAGDDENLSIEETRAAVQMRLLDIADEGDAGVSAQRRASAVSQRRSRRSNARAKRAAERASAVERDAEAKLRAADERLAAAEKTVEQQADRAQHAEEGQSRERDRAERYLRTIQALLVGLGLAGAAVLVLLVLDEIETLTVVALIGVTLIYIRYAWDYVQDPDKTVDGLIKTACFEAGIFLALELLLDVT